MDVPVIDFSKLNGKDRAQTLADISAACEQWGFFQLVNHGIPVELLERVKVVCSEWFEEEREEGFKDSKPYQLMEKYLHGELEGDEVICKNIFRDMDWEDVITLTDQTEWPSFPKNFKETMKNYRSELKNLAETLLEVIEENLNLNKGYIKQTFSCNQSIQDNQEPFFGTKTSHYPPCPRPDMAIGLRAHTDAGGLILLFQDDKVGGLQVLKDNTWVNVKPLENAIVINTGDQIEVLSNGRYKSAWHRILVDRVGNRRSIASFYNPSMKAFIAPAVEEEADGSYPSFVFGDYMDVYVKQKFMEKESRFEAMKNN